MQSYRFKSGAAWRFRTKNFIVELQLERIHGYRYDGDDEEGETQAAIDLGDLHAFESTVNVYLRGEDEPIGSDNLYGSVYDNPDEFFTAHRDPDPKNRNCSLYPDRRICHYFPDMVREAIREARETLIARRKALPYIRES